jgi:hypothetical protein
MLSAFIKECPVSPRFREIRLIRGRRFDVLDGAGGGGAASVRVPLLRPQEPWRVPAGRPCGPLLTPEPLRPLSAGVPGQAGGLPSPAAAHHPGYPALTGRSGWCCP